MPLPSEVHPSQRHKYTKCKNPECNQLTRAEVTGYCRTCLRAQREVTWSGGDEPCESQVVLAHEVAPVPPLSIWAVDIECTNLNSSFGRILCVGLYNMSNPESAPIVLEAFTPDEEPELLENLRELWDDMDIIVGYNSRKFDYRYLNGRAVQHHLKPFPRKLHIDLLKYTRLWRLGRASLDTVAKQLKLPVQKVHCSPEIWIRAQALDRGAFDKLVAHCRHDVLMLLPLLEAVKPQIVSITLG